MKYRFKYYVHSNYTRHEDAEFLEGEGLDPDIAKEIADLRPGYEVTLELEFDDLTKKFTVLSASL